MRFSPKSTSLQSLLLTIVFALLVVSLVTNAYSFQPPAISPARETNSAREYLIKERQFIENYFFDNVYGGTYYSVDGQGRVLNPSKDVVYQTNVILFLAGVESEVADGQTSHYVGAAASYVVDHLQPGPHGPGTWYAATNRTGGSREWMGWLAPSETYVSYGLLWAYKITGNRTYFDVAKTNLDYQMTHFPDGRVLRDDDLDVSYRSPERMTYYLMWQLTGNQTYLNYAKAFHSVTAGMVGWETAKTNGTVTRLYLHGESILDLVQYSLVSGDQGAISESRERVAQYWAQGGNDYSNSSDHGKDYYQKLLGYDLSLWSATGEETYRAESIRAYREFVKFWDPSPPYGFWASLAKTQKTCFSRGYPAQVDMIPPLIAIDSAMFSQVTAKITDPDYQWLGMNLRGIGVDANTVELLYSINGHDWVGIPMSLSGEGIFIASLPSSLQGQNVQYLITASDHFNNTSRILFTPSGPPLVIDLQPLGFGLAIAMAGAGVAMAVGLGLALTGRREYATAVWATQPASGGRLCRYWGVPCPHRHYRVCIGPTPEAIDQGRYYCHGCIVKNYAYWFENYQRYGKSVDLG